MRKRLYCLLILALLPLSSALAQEPSLTGESVGGWELVSAVPLADWNVHAVEDTTTTVLSPDASHLAWINTPNDAICIAEVADSSLDPICYTSRDELLNLRNARRLVWSPDSRYLAFVDTNLVYLEEGDVWVVDTATGEINNLTPDGVYGSMLGPQGNGTMQIDLYPTWSPDGSLYFIRAVTGEEGYPIALYRFPRSVEAWGDLTLVADLTPQLGTTIPLYESAPVSFEGPLSFSPDGAWLALATNAYGADSTTFSGVFLLELATNQLTPLVSRAELLQAQLPDENTEQLDSFFVNGVGWTSDGSQLLTTLMNSDFGPPFSVQSYQIDIASQAITPLFEFGELNATDIQLRDDGTPSTYDISTYTYMLGDVVLIRNDWPSGFSAIDLNNPSELPIRLTAPQGIEGYQRSDFLVSSMGSDGVNTYVLLDGYILTFTPTD